MSKKIIKFCLTTIGLAFLVGCIVQEVDGIGRGFMIIMGTICVYMGLFIKNK